MNILGIIVNISFFIFKSIKICFRSVYSEYLNHPDISLYVKIIQISSRVGEERNWASTSKSDVNCLLSNQGRTQTRSQGGGQFSPPLAKNIFVTPKKHMYCVHQKVK